MKAGDKLKMRKIDGFTDTVCVSLNEEEKIENR